MRNLFIVSLVAACSGGGAGKVEEDDDDIGGDEDDLPIDSGDHEGQDSDEPLPDESEVEDNLDSRSGDFAYDFLTDEDYDRLIIEVDWVAGNEPDDGALAALVAAIEDLCNKPGGVEVVLDDEIPPQGSPAWSYEQGEELELTWRDRYRDADSGEAVLYYLYLDGHSDQDTDTGKILGYAYHGSSLVMFKETMESTGGGLFPTGTIEETVIVHELGHVLGLVDNGIPMVEDHKDPDPERGDHDANEDCIMYWAAETDAIVDLLGLGGSPDFDDACRADVAAAGGKDTL